MKRQRVWFGMLVISLLLVLTMGSTSVQQTPGRSGPVGLSPDEAIAAAVNELAPSADGYHLRHPKHTATFAPAGLEFGARDVGPTWSWRLAAVTTGGSPVSGVDVGAVRPLGQGPLVVAYARGGLVEQYLVKKNTIEQQFLIPRPLRLGGNDLVIAGTVDCEGEFEETEEGWLWGSTDSVVRLGRVLVYDALGKILPATMAVTADTTRIAVDGAALAQAAYPVTVDPEIGADFVLSSMHGYGDPDFDAVNPAVAFNVRDQQYLVVWSGADDVAGEYEIWGQRVNAVTGQQLGPDFQISYMGPAGNPNYDAQDPDVAYNHTSRQYLVVWSAEHYANEEFEIFGQRLDASDGTPAGSRVRVSVMGGTTNPDYDAHDPAVVWNSISNQYLIVWEGDHIAGSLADDEFEIWAKRLSAAGEWIDPENRRISDMGGSGNANYVARDPDVVYNYHNNQYLVVWEGDDTTPGLADNEFEIWGQRLDSSLGGLGNNDFRISAMGLDGDANYDAFDPAIAFNSIDDEYLVVWEGEYVIADTFDIFSRRLGADGSLVGTTHSRLSNGGDGANMAYTALNPAVAYNWARNEYMVVWQGDELGPGEFEIWGQRVAGSNGASIEGDTRLSDMGDEGNAAHDAQTPALDYSYAPIDHFLVVWSGDNRTDGEFEIWAQRFSPTYRVHLPVIKRND